MNFDDWLKKEGLYDDYQDAGPSEAKEIEEMYYAAEEKENSKRRKKK